MSKDMRTSLGLHSYISKSIPNQFSKLGITYSETQLKPMPHFMKSIVKTVVHHLQILLKQARLDAPNVIRCLKMNYMCI